MATSRIRVSYTGPTNFLASDQWIQIRTGLDKHLPLRNLQWKPANATDSQVHTISKVEVDFVSLESLKEEGSSQVPTSLLDRPFMNLFVFACEDNETYRTTYKKQVKDWQSFISSKRHQEWLVILVVRPDARVTGASRIFSMRAPVLDKVKADINIDKKKDRCVELAWPMNADDGAAWNELMTKLKEGIMGSFEALVAMRQEEMTRSEGQRLLPGWNFCTYFILKESLATSYEGMGLIDEALQQYQELEESFFQALREKNLPWFGNVGGTAQGDDSRSILDVTQKAYRDLILNNTITLFDFRIYLFACQMILLAKQQRLMDVISRGHLFVVSFARTLKENERSFTVFFLESWIYSSAMNIIAQCEEVLDRFPALQKDSSFLVQYASMKGELVDLARNQLDKIGIHLGFLPNTPPFSLTSTIVPKYVDGNPPNSKITRKELQDVLGSQSAFNALYVSTTQKAIEYYAEGKRRKFALKLHGDLAAFDQLCGQYPTAHQTFSSLPAHYSSAKHKWPPLEAFMLARSLDVHQKASLPKDKPWLENALSFIGLCASLEEKGGVEESGTRQGVGVGVLDSIAWGSEGRKMNMEERGVYLGELMRDVTIVLDGLEEGITKTEFAAFELRLATGQARLTGDQDGSLVDLVLANRLPCDVKLDHISLELSAGEDETFTYSKGEILATNGSQVITLACPDTHTGTFRVLSSTIQLSKITLTYNYPTIDASLPPAPTSPLTGSLIVPSDPAHLSTRWLLRVPEDRKAVDVKMLLPRSIQWDSKPTAQFELYSGRNDVEDAVVMITGINGVDFRMNEAEMLSDAHYPTIFVPKKESLTFKSIKSDQKISFCVPHSIPSSGSLVIASINVQYQISGAEKEKPKRTLQVTRKVSTSLPLQVSVMDSFRGRTLISKFTVSTTSHLQVRVKDTTLVGGTGLKIIGPRRGSRNPPVIVTPQRPSHFLYQLEAESPRYERETLYLSVRYRTMREEIERRLEKVVREAITEKSLPISGVEDVEDAVEKTKGRLIAELGKDASWVQGYIYADELGLPVPSSSTDADPVDVLVEEATRRLRESTSDDGGIRVEDWNELIIPVDLPFMHILSAVQMHVISDVESIYAGQPVSVRAEINTSFYWGSVKPRGKQGDANEDGGSDVQYKMRYIVQELVTDWLVSGCKRGDFIATNEGSHSIDLTLVPLHHGELSLPKIVVSPLPSTSASSTTQPTTAITAKGEGPSVQSSLPSTETYHLHAAQRIMVLPRGGRSTFVVGMGGDL